MSDQIINPDLVREMFYDSLFRDEEVTKGQTPAGAVLVEGIVRNVGFHPDRLRSHSDQVKQWLSLLPHQFREGKGGGGGWSFLEACNQEDGAQWTGMHQTMEQLFQLGIGLGMAKWLLPRSYWTMLPGGMPYVSVVIEGEEE